jgi:hypothetical protein
MTVPRLAGSAAARGVVEANVAAAALLQAALQRRTAGLEDRAARLVAAGAGDAAAILCVFTLADAAGQVALADAQSVERTAAGAQPARERAAEIVQRGTGNVVIAVAVDLKSTGALLNLHGASGNDTPSGRRSGGEAGLRRRNGRSTGRTKEQTSFQHHRT